MVPDAVEQTHNHTWTSFIVTFVPNALYKGIKKCLNICVNNCFFFNSINETSESVFASRLSLHFDGLQWGSPSVLCVELFTCLFLRIGPLACIFDSKLRHQLGMVQPLV